MIDHVLVPIDGSARATDALAYAMEAHPQARLTILYVIDYVEESYTAELLVGSDALRGRAEDRAEDLLADAREVTRDHGGAVTTETVYGKPAREIVDYADDHEVDVIILGSHGRSGVSRVLLGSVAQAVVQRASVPVTVVR
jgi:nucleotide-binding universal stress UspA family protein